MTFSTSITKKKKSLKFFPVCVVSIKIIMSKCLQEDNLNLKGLALFSLHPRAYITTTQRAESNIHSRLCLQGTICNYFIYAPPSETPKNWKAALKQHKSNISKQLVQYFPCLQRQKKYIFFLSKQNTCTHTKWISKLILPRSFSNLCDKRTCFFDLYPQQYGILQGYAKDCVFTYLSGAL